jgi:hypothetical protein
LAYSTPRTPAGKALRLVNAKNRAASWTGPSFLFISDELPDTDFLDVHEILDHAHGILGSIAFIQVFQPIAGKTVTAETEPVFILCHILAFLDSTRGAGFGFDADVTPAAGTWILGSSVGDAKTTIYAAGGDQRRWNRMGLVRPFHHHVNSDFLFILTIPSNSFISTPAFV